jgi:hypothetical protein
MMEQEFRIRVSIHMQHEMTRDPQTFENPNSPLKILGARIERSSMPITHKY